MRTEVTKPEDVAKMIVLKAPTRQNTGWGRPTITLKTHTTFAFKKRSVYQRLAYILSLMKVNFRTTMAFMYMTMLVSAHPTIQSFGSEPMDQIALEGSKVTLPCRIISRIGIVQWTRDDFGLGPSRNLSGFERYSMVGSDDEGDFSLEIFPINLEDDGRYQCQVSPGPNGERGIRSKYASITVLIHPKPPKITQGLTLTTTEDSETEIECISPEGKPAADIYWEDEDGVVPTSRYSYTTSLLPDGRRLTARSVLKMVPRRRHHNTSVMCSAQNTADRMPRTTSVRLEVRYAPQVSVKIISGAAPNGQIHEGSTVWLGCDAHAFPNDLTYRWSINDVTLVGDFTTTYPIFNITKKFHDSIVKCEVHNSVGKSEESETLDVTDKPSLEDSEDVLAKIGNKVTLDCDLNGKLKPGVTNEDEDRWSVVGSTPNLTLTVDETTVGRYNCKATTHGSPDIETKAVILLKGPPHVISPRILFGVEGDNVRLECRALAIPKPTKITWLSFGKDLTSTFDHEYSVFEDYLADGIKSILVIRESKKKQFVPYNCTVKNDYGIDISEILLVRRKTVSSIVLYGSIIGSIVLVIAIIAVIVICIRKRRAAASAEAMMNVDVMPDVDKSEADMASFMGVKLDYQNEEDHCNPEYATQDFRTGMPLAGPVALPSHSSSLLMQFSRYSNDYTDHGFPTNIEYKDGQHNSGYSGYAGYGRDYNPSPVPVHIQPRVHSGPEQQPAPRTHFTSRLATAQHHAPTGGSLIRQIDRDSLPSTSSLQRTKESLNSVGLPSASYNRNQQSGILQPNDGNMLTPAGVDVRYSATYGNPFLRSEATINTANPSATPAPPPYNSIRKSMKNTIAIGTNSRGGMAQPQVALLPPSSQYILPLATYSTNQTIQLTDKGTKVATKQQTHATNV